MQLGLLHRTWLGQLLARTWLLRWYFRWSSANLGRKYDVPESRRLIPRFIRVWKASFCMQGLRLAAHRHACMLTGPLACCSMGALIINIHLHRSMQWTQAVLSGQRASTAL